MPGRGVLAAATAVALVAALAGCAATPAKPAVSALVASPDGLGSLVVGSPVPASSPLVGYGPNTCPHGGGWLPAYPHGTDDSGGQSLSPFDVVTADAAESGNIVDIFVWSRSIATAKKIRVGSTQAQVAAAYPRAREKKAYASVLYVVPGAHGKLVIEVAGRNDDAAGEWPTSELGTVVWMTVAAQKAEVESLAGSDDAGPCPVKGHVPVLGDDDDDD